MIVLDTVNPNGYADGSLDEPQFTWMKQVIDGVRRQAGGHVQPPHQRHDGEPLGGDRRLDLNPRVLGTEVVVYLLTKPQVIAWVNGHTHRNEILAHTSDAAGFWEINTASHIDFPQQARIIEIADNTDGTLSIFTTILDHAAPAAFNGNLDSPVSLAALSRELSANDWQQHRVTERQATSTPS